MADPIVEKRIEFQASFSCFLFHRCVLKGDSLFVIMNQNSEYEIYFPGENKPWAWLSRIDLNKFAGAVIV